MLVVFRAQLYFQNREKDESVFKKEEFPHTVVSIGTSICRH